MNRRKFVAAGAAALPGARALGETQHEAFTAQCAQIIEQILNERPRDWGYIEGALSVALERYESSDEFTEQQNDRLTRLGFQQYGCAKCGEKGHRQASWDDSGRPSDMCPRCMELCQEKWGDS